MIKVQILAVKKQIYKAGTADEQKYETLTVLLADGDTAKVNNYTSKEAKAGQSAVLTLQSDRKTGGLVVRCTDIA